MQNKIIRLCCLCLISASALVSCSSYSSKNNSVSDNFWKKQAHGIWTKTYNSPKGLDLLSQSGKPPRFSLINKLPDNIFPLDSSEIKVFTKEGKTYVRFPLDKKEQIFGLGLNFKTVHQRGRIMRLHMDHYGGTDNGRSHAPVPFFVSSKGYGVLINAAKYIDVYVGTGVSRDSKHPAPVVDRNTHSDWNPQPYSDNLELMIPDEGVKMIVFSGKSVLDVVQKYNLYCGGGFIPPKWGLGFWHRTPTLYTQDDVEREVADFKKHNFPLDIIGLEPGWHSKAYPCTFVWDSTRFSSPKQFLTNLDQQGIKTNLWCNPYLWPGTDLEKKLHRYTADHTVWTGNIVDYSIQEARNIMEKHLDQNEVSIGVSGFKIDEVDGVDSWLWPDNTQFPSGHSAEEMRQLYGNYMMKLTDELYRAKNKRTYGLIRAENAGSVSYPYVIYNDYYSHPDFINALISSSFIGVLWTPEVRASKNADEWLRRMKTVCFSSLAMVNAWADGTKPWSFPSVYDACQNVAQLRMQLLPYIYSTFAQYYFEGKPPFRAMDMVDGFSAKESTEKGTLDGTDNPYAMATKKEIRDQYMMGDYILVAPFVSDSKERTVVLPKGNWYDYYSGKKVGNGEVITISNEKDKVPLFVKDGALIPTIPVVRQTRDWSKDLAITVRVYGNASGEFNLYNDDGDSYDYEKGNFSIQKLHYESNKNYSVKQEGDKKWQYSNIEWEQI